MSETKKYLLGVVSPEDRPLGLAARDLLQDAYPTLSTIFTRGLHIAKIEGPFNELIDQMLAKRTEVAAAAFHLDRVTDDTLAAIPKLKAAIDELGIPVTLLHSLVLGGQHFDTTETSGDLRSRLRPDLDENDPSNMKVAALRDSGAKVHGPNSYGTANMQILAIQHAMTLGELTTGNVYEKAENPPLQKRRWQTSKIPGGTPLKVTRKPDRPTFVRVTVAGTERYIPEGQMATSRLLRETSLITVKRDFQTGEPIVLEPICSYTRQET